MRQAKQPATLTGRAEHILGLLEETGDWCSGERLSALLGISRAAVAKRIAGLRRHGHVIQSVTGRGHRLLLKKEDLDPVVVKDNLRTRSMGRGEWHMHAETTSSSDEAIRLALAGAAEGSVVVAESQSRGRGRKGHFWFSAPRGLMFSVLLRPSAPTATPARLTRLGVLAVAEAVEERTGLCPTIKTPNDVLIGRRKMAGVLLETGMRGGEPDWAVLGIGCNVNALPEEFPAALRNSATSVFAESGRAACRAGLLAAILNRLEFWYERLESGDQKALQEQWEQRIAGQGASRNAGILPIRKLSLPE